MEFASGNAIIRTLSVPNYSSPALKIINNTHLVSRRFIGLGIYHNMYHIIYLLLVLLMYLDSHSVAYLFEKIS